MTEVTDHTDKEEDDDDDDDDKYDGTGARPLSWDSGLLRCRIHKHSVQVRPPALNSKLLSEDNV